MHGSVFDFWHCVQEFGLWGWVPLRLLFGFATSVSVAVPVPVPVPLSLSLPPPNVKALRGLLYRGLYT